MKPILSNIQCVSVFVTELFTKANLKYSPDSSSELHYDHLNIKTELFPPNKNQNARQINLSVSHEPKENENSPYSFLVKITGFFTCENVDKKNEDRFIEIQGSSVLFGMARDALIDNMTKGPWSSIFLPLVSFYQSDGSQKAIAQTSETQKAIAQPAKKPRKRTAKKSTKKKTTKNKQQ